MAGKLPMLDAFAGIGGFSLALKSAFKTVIYCEIDPACQCCSEESHDEETPTEGSSACRRSRPRIDRLQSLAASCYIDSR